MNQLLFQSKLIFFLFIFAANVYSAPNEDLVTGLLSGLYEGKIYSGYLDTTDSSRSLHYMFLPSQNKPESDPVVLWLNGGPGCSSLLGLFMENGPVVIDDYNSTFFKNEFSWNKHANMLYLESPAGVGFSYAANEQDLKSSDEKSGQDNRKALLNFFLKFSEFKKNEFYIAGESYAGVYVPYLAKLILDNYDDINLKGILVGNGLTDVTVDVEEALVDFAFEHALYSPEVYDQFNKYCSDITIENRLFGDFHPKNVTKACNKARQQIRDSLQGLNIYDIYRECPSSNRTNSYQQSTIKTLQKFKKTKKQDKYLTVEDDLEPEFHIWPDGCAEDVNLANFLNDEKTKKALHIDKPLTWQRCNGVINENYTVTDASFNIYQKTLINSKLRMWFYSGDTDAAVPFNGSIRWIPKLGLNVTEEYRKWVVNNQTAGYIQSYGSFKYITIKGTGHMAPQWKREEVYVMFNSFLQDTLLPK